MTDAYPPPPPGNLPPQPTYPYAGGELPTPSKSLAVWAFVLALVPACITTVAGAVMAIVVLTSKGRHGGRGFAIAALVVTVLWTLLLGGLMALGIAVSEDEPESAERDADGTVSRTQEISIFDVAKGDCIRVPKGDVVYSVRAVPCEKPHHAEAYATWKLTGSEFPGAQEVSRTAEAGCAQRFAKFIGMSYDESRLEIYFLHPTKESWNLRNDRGVTCLVRKPDNRTTVGTLRNARR